MRNRFVPGRLLLLGVLGALASPVEATAASSRRTLEHSLGRNDLRVYSARHTIHPGDRLKGSALPDRLTQLGYRRVRAKPTSPGEFFWGFERFWIYLRGDAMPGRRGAPPRLIEISIERASGRVLRIDEEGSGESLRRVALEPALLAESLKERRAPRRWVTFEAFPEHTWRSVLAIEDTRFFEHGGVDPRSVARALLKNAKAGSITQGGSTITQQLVKIRDLTPKRTLGRKLSEAGRALAIEAEYEKEAILEAYLNSIYMGHASGVSLYGLDAAARAYFAKKPEELTLSESAVLAAMIQGPNRLDPRSYPDRVRARQLRVLERLAELGWLSQGEIDRARRGGLPRLRTGSTGRHALPSLLGWLRDELEAVAPKRAREDRDLLVETTLDPYLQRLARASMAAGLARIEKRLPRRSRGELAGALVALDGTSGDVLAAVGADPRRGGEFDRARSARRQPGSTVKPFVVMEALERCGDRGPLHVARRVVDRPVRLSLPSGAWSPENPTGRYRGVVSLRTTLVDSLNVPLVRLARHCGFPATAERFGAAGLPLPSDAPPSFVLGAVEISPVELASAYSAFVDLGRRHRPRLVTRVSAASGRGLARVKARSSRVSRPATAFLVRDLLREAGRRSLGTPAFDRHEVIGKTGTSSNQRDAWFAGAVGSMVVVTWVGLDGGGSLGLSGAQAASPIWREFAEASATALRMLPLERPRTVVERWIDPKSGRQVRSGRGESRRELFRDGVEPPRGGLIFRGRPEPVIE